MSTQGWYKISQRSLESSFQEPVLEDLGNGDFICGVEIGCDVLSSAKLGFVDVDYEDVINARYSMAGVFRKAGISTTHASTVIALDLVWRWLKANPRDSFRVYETAAGLRYILTSRVLYPASPATFKMLQQLGCDRRYSELCKSQSNFRARLTPKPWRLIGFRAEPGHDDPAMPPGCMSDPESFQFQRYKERSPHFATCSYLGTIGSGKILTEFEPLITLHDERTKATSGLPLA